MRFRSRYDYVVASREELATLATTKFQEKIEFKRTGRAYVWAISPSRVLYTTDIDHFYKGDPVKWHVVYTDDTRAINPRIMLQKLLGLFWAVALRVKSAPKRKAEHNDPFLPMPDIVEVKKDKDTAISMHRNAWFVVAVFRVWLKLWSFKYGITAGTLIKLVTIGHRLLPWKAKSSERVRVKGTNLFDIVDALRVRAIRLPKIIHQMMARFSAFPIGLVMLKQHVEPKRFYYIILNDLLKYPIGCAHVIHKFIVAVAFQNYQWEDSRREINSRRAASLPLGTLLEGDYIHLYAQNHVLHLHPGVDYDAQLAQIPPPTIITPELYNKFIQSLPGWVKRANAMNKVGGIAHLVSTHKMEWVNTQFPGMFHEPHNYVGRLVYDYLCCNDTAVQNAVDEILDDGNLEAVPHVNTQWVGITKDDIHWAMDELEMARPQYLKKGGKITKRIISDLMTKIRDGHSIYGQQHHLNADLRPITSKTPFRTAVRITKRNHEIHLELEKMANEEKDKLPTFVPDWWERVYTPELEELRMKTQGHMRLSGLELHHCIGSYAGSSRYMHFRKGDICAQIDVYSAPDFRLSQCYDKFDQKTDASRAFEKWVMMQFHILRNRCINGWNNADHPELLSENQEENLDPPENDNVQRFYGLTPEDYFPPDPEVFGA